MRLETPPADSAGSERLAVEFEALEEEIIEAYRARLVDHKNPIGMHVEAWADEAEQARHVLSECAYALRHRTEPPRPSVRQMQRVRELGKNRPTQGISANNSLEAGTLLFQSVSFFLCRLLDGRPDAGDQLHLALSILQDRITCRLANSVYGHEMFLLKFLREAAKEYRSHLAREVHDRIGSSASLALRQLELFELICKSPLQDDLRLNGAKLAIVETLHMARNIVTQLRTRTDSAESLQSALTAYLSAMSVAEPTVDIRVHDPERLLSGPLSDELFMMLRECLRNALAHAMATHVSLSVDVDPQRVRAVVTDDGVGFDPERSKGNGLASLVERVDQLGGTLTVRSTPMDGTTVEIVAPLTEENRAFTGE